MSKSIKVVMALGLFAVVAACAQKEEEIVYTQPAISSEPVYTGKYK
ncbi:hypothetical protein [Oceaniovalibus sp. ACAM 378]|jgi:uncharacterized lipoprotein YehR (DUF1307 family)|nr:hypothetical protein [Oceaniovalibus sp. ACAM 378]